MVLALPAEQPELRAPPASAGAVCVSSPWPLLETSDTLEIEIWHVSVEAPEQAPVEAPLQFKNNVGGLPGFEVGEPELEPQPRTQSLLREVGAKVVVMS